MKATKIRVTLDGGDGPVVVEVFAHFNDNQPNKEVIAEAVRSTHPQLKHLPIVETEEVIIYERRITTSTPNPSRSGDSEHLFRKMFHCVWDRNRNTGVPTRPHSETVDDE